LRRQQLWRRLIEPGFTSADTRQQEDELVDNPYEAPTADLTTPDEQSKRLDIFKRFSTWYVFGLSIITLNLYILYWFYSRTKTLNRLEGISPISDTFMATVIMLNVVSIPVAFAEPYFAANQNFVIMTNTLTILATISLIVWAFRFRHRLNYFLNQHQSPHRTAGPVFTFLFQALHLSYKINENLELLEKASAYEPTQDQATDEENPVETAEASSQT
jgi:hypothetical protein